MAKRHAFEIATWPCSEEYVRDQSLIRPAFELLTGPEGRWGLTEIFYGVEIGKANAYAVLNWESMEAHERFQSDQETLFRFYKLFESSAEGGIPKGTVIHASWEERAALPCLKAPLVELKKISPKNGVTMGAIHKALDKYIAYMNNLAATVGAAYGHVIEEPEQFLLVVGWKSTEARKDSITAANGQEVVREMEEMAEEEVINVSLGEFSMSCSGEEGSCYENVSS